MIAVRKSAGGSAIATDQQEAFSEVQANGFSGSESCTLCSGRLTLPWQVVDGCRFFRCATCDLIQRPPEDWPPIETERAHYRQHHNDPNDARYRAFLNRCFEPLSKHLSAGAEGLDFGCGPGRAISQLALEQGLTVTSWDPAFFPDAGALRRSYDFLIATEVLEHLHDPATTLHKMDQLVKPGGWLAVMTHVYDGTLAWSRWNYWRDITHVCFYTGQTFDWITQRLGYPPPELPHPNVRIWKKPESSRLP